MFSCRKSNCKKNRREIWYRNRI